MDINQIAGMIEWLDEERRRDKATIATLEERLARQQEVMDNMSRRLNSVESDQTVIKHESLPAQREYDIMDTVRQEMHKLLESSESRRLNAEREAERRGELSRESLARTVKDLSEKLSRLERQSSELTDLRSEADRLISSVTVLQQRLDDMLKKLEEPDRRLSFLEEQRRQDTRRLSETETELPELKKQIDSIRPKVTLIEDLSIRNERRIQEVQNSERERREQIQQFIDQQTLMMQQRDQQIESLVERFGEQDSAMQRNMERFEVWAQTYRDMKRIIDDFERIGDRLERRINEVAEMQRLSEERFRQEWNDWREDDQRRWKQFNLSNDDVWRNHDKEFESYVNRLIELQGTIPSLVDAINRLWKLERDRAQLYREGYQTLILEHDKGSNISSPAPIAGQIGQNNSSNTSG